MKKNDVSVGGRYVVKVSDRLVPVRILRVCSYGGWTGLNEKTGREIHIKTAARLRFPVVAKAPAPKPAGEYYAELDEDTGLFCVFHTETDKAFGSYSSMEEAEEKADEMNRSFKST